MMLLFLNGPYSHKNYLVMIVHFLIQFSFLLFTWFNACLISQMKILKGTKLSLMICFHLLRLRTTYSKVSFRPLQMQAEFLVVTKFIRYLP